MFENEKEKGKGKGVRLGWVTFDFGTGGEIRREKISRFPMERAREGGRYTFRILLHKPFFVCIYNNSHNSIVNVTFSIP